MLSKVCSQYQDWETDSSFISLIIIFLQLRQGSFSFKNNNYFQLALIGLSVINGYVLEMATSRSSLLALVYFTAEGFYCLSVTGNVISFHGSLHFCQYSCHDYQLQINIEKTKRILRKLIPCLTYQNTYSKLRWLFSITVCFLQTELSTINNFSIFRERFLRYKCMAIPPPRFRWTLAGGPINGFLSGCTSKHNITRLIQLSNKWAQLEAKNNGIKTWLICKLPHIASSLCGGLKSWMREAFRQKNGQEKSFYGHHCHVFGTNFTREWND